MDERLGVERRRIPGNNTPPLIAIFGIAILVIVIFLLKKELLKLLRFRKLEYYTNDEYEELRS